MTAKTCTPPFLVQRSYHARPLLVLAWRALVAGWARSRRHSRAAAELRAMGTRELKDLGIGQGEVEHLLRQQPPARRRATWP